VDVPLRAAGDTSARVPLSSMRFSPPLDDDNAEPAGVLAMTAVTVE
jgi:hypothetical protein